MPAESPWHERDDVWRTLMPVLFREDRIAQADEEIDALLALVSPEPGAQVLDMCCGIGRHSCALAQRGLSVTGVDRTRVYLEEARRAAASQGLQIELVHEDMRRFVRPGAFDLAINLFTSFGYFGDPADDLLAARNIAKSLKAGGVLCLDTMSKERLARIFQPRDWEWVGDTMFIAERWLEADWSWINNRWTLLRGTERVDIELGHRLYAASELCALMRQAGFAEVRAFGGLDGRPYDHEARRLVVVARTGGEQ